MSARSEHLERIAFFKAKSNHLRYALVEKPNAIERMGASIHWRAVHRYLRENHVPDLIRLNDFALWQAQL
jgi:hypothetical protein